MTHDPHSPQPQHGAWYRFERAQAFNVVTSYKGKWPLYGRLRKRFKASFGRWWFLSVNVGFAHFYVGHKPINLADAGFYVPDGFPRDLPAVEFSVRVGAGAPS